MRHENGYGTVALIDKKSKRRKPYRVQVHTGWTDEGKPIRKTVGYAETRSKGRQMLAEYHNQLFDLDMNNVSFSFLYEKWYAYKSKTGIGESAIKKYTFLRKFYNGIENKPFINITREDLQNIVDNCSGNGSYQNRIKNLYHQMYIYAKGNNIKVGNDVSILVINDKITGSNLHKPFSNEEIQTLWNNRDDFIDLILINIYTGIRPGEFLKITEVHENYFITGSKTESGKNRVIPLNDKIIPLFKKAYNSQIFDKFPSEDTYYQKFKKVVKLLKMDHTPYDARHTFATLMARANADEHCVKLIMGHRIQDLTKRVYTHKMIDELIREVNKI